MSVQLSIEGDTCVNPMIIFPPKGADWKQFGGKFANVSEEMKKVFEEATKRSRND